MSVSRDGVVLTGALAQPRRLAILALLARAGDRGVTREKVLALLWPDLEEERARPNLAQALYALRRDLGGDETIGGVKDLRLELSQVTADVLSWEAACRAGDLTRAASLYTGPFLDGFHLAGSEEFARWADSERTDLAHAYTAVLEKLAVAAGGAGDALGALGWWRKLASQEPLSGRIALRLMQALVAAGDRAGAINHARVHATLVQQQLETPADPDVADFAERLRTEVPGNAPRSEPLVTTTPPVPSAIPELVAATPVIAPSPVTERGEETTSRRWHTVTLMSLAVVALAMVAIIWHPWRHERTLPVPGQTARISAGPDLELDPALSPDGKLLAYAAGAPGDTRIHVRQLTGGRVIEVSGNAPRPQRLPQWSPDGETLVFQARDAVYSVAALGGAARLLVPADTVLAHILSPTISPDGSSLAYVRGDDIRIRSLTDESERTIATLDEPHSLKWSPDGRRLALVERNPVFVIGASAPARGVTNLGNLAPSRIWIVTVDGSRPAVRVTAPDRRSLSPVWSPDGNRLLYVSDHEGNRDVYVMTIADDGTPLSAPARLTTGINVHSISLSGDGSKLAYAVFTFTNNIWAVDIPASGVVSVRAAVPITTGQQTVEGLAVSRDGRWLAFDSDRSGNQDIWRLALAGGEPEQLTVTPWDDFMPVWSPDGSELSFYSFIEGRRRVYVMPLAGGTPTAVTDGRLDDRYSHWAADGQTLSFSRYVTDRYQVHRVSREGAAWGVPTMLTREGGDAARWSPDGTRLLFFQHRNQPVLALRVMAADGSDARDVVSESTTGPYPLLAEWSPDGSRIYYKAFDDAGNSTFWEVSPRGGTPRLLMRFDDPTRPTSRAEFATDGRRLYFTVGRPESDVWVMDLEGGW